LVVKATFGHGARRGIAGLAAAVGMLGFAVLGAASAQASTASPTFACEGTYFTSVQFSISQSFSASAPASEFPGVQFTGKAVPAAWTVPTSVDGITISALQDLSLTIGTTDATVISASISGGSNLGSGTPSVSVSGTNVVLSVPGPLTAGATVTLPTVKLTLEGNAAGTVTSYFTGTSYASPGLTVTAVVPGSPPIDAGAACYPTSGADITSTTIV
jgi:dehydratase